MAEITFIDQTVRDGQQSLWGMKMRAAHILPITDDLDRAGFSCIELTGTTIHTVLVREFKEDPYAGLDLITSRMPRTHLRGGMRPDTAGFTLQPYSVIDLSVSVMAAHGIDSFWIFDCLYNLDKMERQAAGAARQNLRPCWQLLSTLWWICASALPTCSSQTPTQGMRHMPCVLRLSCPGL